MNPILDKFPALLDVDPARLTEVNARLTAVLAEQYPDIDVQPNSVFGDTVLRPLVYLIAGTEQALSCTLSDLDLRNVAQGNICDCDFVRAYLENLGIRDGSDLPTVATLRLLYNTDAARQISNTTRFLFDGVLVRPFTTLSSEIDILESAASRADPDQNIFRLTPTLGDQFYVDLVVYGPAGIEVPAETTATSDIDDEFLDSIQLVTPLRPTFFGGTVQELAEKASRLFPASGLTTRASASSFILNKLANVKAVSPVTTGDSEMTRGVQNLFGVTRGAVDIYPRGDLLLTTTVVSRLSRDTTAEEWRGRIKTNSHTPLRIRSIRTLGGTELVAPLIWGTSSDPLLFPEMSAAFSRMETLGISFPDTDPTLNAEITAENTPASLPASTAGPEGGLILLSGSYRGHLFSGDFTQALQFQGVTDEAPHLFRVTNLDTGETVENVTTTENAGVFVLDTDFSPLLESWTRGVTISFDLDGLDSFDGATFSANLEAPGGYVVVEYDYDPVLGEVESLIKHDTQRGPLHIAAMSPKPVLLTNLRIEYRTKNGKWVDTETARQEILDYVNSSLYPDGLSDSTLSDILMFAGASGINRITKTATVWSTLANRYVLDGRDPEDSGVPALVREVEADFYDETFEGSRNLDWSSGSTTDQLISITEDYLLTTGPRNVQFLLPVANLKLVEDRTL